MVSNGRSRGTGSTCLRLSSTRLPTEAHDVPWRLVGVLAAVDAAVVVGIAAHDHGFAAAHVVAAALLAPVAVASVARIATRLAGGRLGVAAALVYIGLPVLGQRYFYGPFLHVYATSLRGAFVGLRDTGMFATGVAAAVFVAVAPRRLAGIVGLVAALVALVVWADGPWGALYGDFHETTWSPGLLCFLPAAGVVGASRREPWLAAALGGWLTVFVLRGLHRPYVEGGFWLSLVAAVPACAVLLTSLALLVPPLRAPGRRPVSTNAP